jgi:hypothetical protein
LFSAAPPCRPRPCLAARRTRVDATKPSLGKPHSRPCSSVRKTMSPSCSAPSMSTSAAPSCRSSVVARRRVHLFAAAHPCALTCTRTHTHAHKLTTSLAQTPESRRCRARSFTLPWISVPSAAIETPSPRAPSPPRRASARPPSCTRSSPVLATPASTSSRSVPPHQASPCRRQAGASAQGRDFLGPMGPLGLPEPCRVAYGRATVQPRRR